MGTKILNNLLVILLLTAITAPWLVAIAAAKPLGMDPSWPNWPAGTLWGARLMIENNSSGGGYFGAKTGAEDDYFAPPSPQQPYIWMVFRGGSPTADQAEIARTEPAAPQSYTWYVKMVYSSGNGDNVDAKIWAELENTTNLFIPQDYSVVLENQARSIGPWNLRKENGSINLVDGVTRFAILHVDNAVNVSISPSSLSGTVGDNVNFTVTVQNTGKYSDNYSLDVDAGGWPYSIVPSSLSISAGNSANATLTVTIGAGTKAIIVTADGYYASDNCTASAFGMPVSISISPSEKSALPGENVDFAVTVKNLEENADNYALGVGDNLVWNPTLTDNFFENVAPGDNRTTKLTVMIPGNVGLGAKDNIIVVVIPKAYPGVSDNATCIARAGFYGVEVSILPDYQENAPGGKLNYTVMVSNTGDLDDNYNLTFTDNIDSSTYWEENISLDNSLLVVPAGENLTTTLRVAIPDNAPPGTDDNIIVTATSQADNTVKNIASCIAHVSRVSISISPGYQSGLPGTVLSENVYIKNNENTKRFYDLIVTDNFGWNLDIGIDNLGFNPFGWDMTGLDITIPENAIGDTEDTVTVTMVSIDNTIRDSGSCIAHVTVVRGVEVSIVPYENEGPPGASLGYTITVNNTGDVEDNYDLTANDNASWGLAILPPSLTILPRGSENATLSVTIPENAEPLITDNIVVTAKSQANPSISAENTCIAFSFATFKENLVNGWNLVSFPIAWENDTPANLLAGHTYYLWEWDPLMLRYVKPSSNNQPVEIGVAYWIWVDNDMTVTTSGVPVENYSINLVAGWNMVGFPVTSPGTTPANLFAGQTYYTWKWDAVNKKYSKPLPNQPVDLGVGYWVYVNMPTSITIPL